jgi:formylmethanofuran:tetrahydromethanopterin formyltransferase
MVLVLLTTTFALAQESDRPSGYDVSTEVTIQGVVDQVDLQECCGDRAGLHLAVRVGELLYEVHLGPSEFVASKNFSFLCDDRVTVVGSKLTGFEPPTVLAREISVNDRTLTLRDAAGRPLWVARKPG